jgi:hypothetical protein
MGGATRTSSTPGRPPPRARRLAPSAARLIRSARVTGRPHSRAAARPRGRRLPAGRRPGRGPPGAAPGRHRRTGPGRGRPSRRWTSRPGTGRPPARADAGDVPAPPTRDRPCQQLLDPLELPVEGVDRVDLGVHAGADVSAGGLVEAFQPGPPLHQPGQGVHGGQGRPVVDQRLAGVGVDDDLPTGHDHMAGLEDLVGGHGQPVEAFTLQDPELAAGLVAGDGEAAVDALPGGRHRHAELGGDLPEAGAGGAQL